MTMIEKVKSIQDIARKNGLSLNKKFTDSYLTSHSMFDGPRELADRIIQGMWDMCVHGINNGFDGSCKSAVDGLSDIVVALTELGNEQIGKLTKYTTKADKLLQAELQARKEVINVTEPVKQCVSSSITAIDTMEELRTSGKALATVSDKQFDLLHESRAILEEIQTVLADVGDTSSKTAQEKADAAVALIREWREACSRNILTSGSVEALRKAKNEITAWSKLAVGVTKKERVKEQHVFRETDNLAVIVEGKASLEMLETFLDRMETEKREIEGIAAQIEEREKTKQAKKDECEAKLDEIKQQKQQIAQAFQNGEFDLQTADRKIKSLNPKEDEILYQLARLKEDAGPDYLQASLEQREVIYSELEGIINVLKDSRSNLVLLADIIYDVNFSALIDMLGGNVTDRNRGEAIKSIHMIIGGISERLKSVADVVSIIETDGIVRHAKVDLPETNRQALIERERNSREQVSDTLSPELAALLQGQQQPQQQEEERPKVGVKRSSLFSDEDR